MAGCNGSGKSSFSKALVDRPIVPYDYDAHFLSIYKSLQPMDIQRQMALSRASEEMEQLFDQALSSRSDFCYETNFNYTPMHWPHLFRSAGFSIHLVYFVLDSISEAKRRVAIRVENGGHFVPEHEIQSRYYEGFENFDRYYAEFDSVDVYDCSFYKEAPKFCFSLSKSELVFFEYVPAFLNPMIPTIKGILNK